MNTIRSTIYTSLVPGCLYRDTDIAEQTGLNISTVRTVMESMHCAMAVNRIAGDQEKGRILKAQPYSGWPDNKPARYYAWIITRLRPDLRAKALSRVPESIRGLVQTHLIIIEQRGRNA